MIQESLAEHFKQYFSLQKALTNELKNQVYQLRYDVYCDEFQYEKNCLEHREVDTFDQYSQHILIKHNTSGRFAGCVRLVTPPAHHLEAPFPFEECCLSSVDTKQFMRIAEEGRQFIGEISRLAVHRDFRRRPGESSNPYGANMSQNNLQTSADEQRLFPFISVSLYLASAAIALENGLKYVIVMMEPRLSRLLARFGIRFARIGEEMEYHGIRAMFYIDRKMLFDNLKPELRELFDFVAEQINRE